MTLQNHNQAYHYWQKQPTRRIRRGAGALLAVAAVILAAYSMTYDDLKPPRVAGYRDCQECHSKQKALEDYFRKAGNQTPEMMAEAVMATRSPRLLAAIAVKGEKNTPYTVRKGGYKKAHAGAWQVNSKYWGRVPHDPIGQALQAEKILTELTEEMPIKKALKQYGGDSTDKYANRVLAELVNVP